MNNPKEYALAARDSEAAFEYAIKQGRLSRRPGDWNYAGDWMFMGRGGDGRDTFKHIATRRYIANPYADIRPEVQA